MINPLRLFQKSMDPKQNEQVAALSGLLEFDQRSQDIESVMSLADKIISHHLQKGAISPLKGSIVADMSFKNSIAKQKHAEGLKYLRMAKEALAERDQLIGIPGLGSQSEVSITFYIKCIHEILVNCGYGSKELSGLGFPAEPSRAGDKENKLLTPK
jgi:hypothetical protein